MSIVPILTGSNWLAFERLMTAYLNSQGLGLHITPGLRWPPSLTASQLTALHDPATSKKDREPLKEINDEWVDFKEENLKAKGYITLKMSPSLQGLVTDSKNAEVLWKELKDKFGKQGLAATFAIYRQIVDWKLKETSNPLIQVPHLVDLINRVTDHGITLNDKMQVMTVLHALPNSWDSFVSNILSHSEDATLDEVLNLISEEWLRRKGNRGGVNSSVVTRGNKHSNPHPVLNMARQNLQQGQPQQKWNSFRGKSFRGRGGKKPFGYRPPGYNPQQGGSYNGTKNVPSRSTNPGKPQWTGQMPGQSKGPNWERNKTAKAKNRANKLAAKAAATYTSNGSPSVMASSTSASIPLMIAKIGDKVNSDFVEELVPFNKLKNKGIHKSQRANGLGLSYASVIDPRGLVSKSVQDVEGESRNRDDPHIPVSTESGYSLPSPPASDQAEMGDDLISGHFASSAISYHHADDEQDNARSDIEYVSEHESSESHGNTSGYEGQYSDHNPDEEMPGSFNNEDDTLAWWYVHQRPYYMNQIRHADLQARRMRSNARTVDQMQRLLGNIVINEETMSLRHDVSSTELSEPSTPHSLPRFLDSTASYTSEQSSPVQRNLTPYDWSRFSSSDDTLVSSTSTSNSIPERWRYYYDNYQDYINMENTQMVNVDTPLVTPRSYRYTDLYNIRNYDANMREWIQRNDVFEPNNNRMNDHQNNFVNINIGHLKDPYNVFCDNTSSCRCPKCYKITKNVISWMFDSGASHHFTPHLDDFTSYENYDKPIIVNTADNQSELLGQGTVILDHILGNGSISRIKLSPVLYMPSANLRLISNGTLCKQGFIAKQDTDKISFYREGSENPILEGYPRLGIETLMWAEGRIIKTDNTALMMSSINVDGYEIWHQRMSHPSQQILKIGSKYLQGFPSLNIPKNLGPCDGCLKGKAVSKHFPLSEKRATLPFEKIHCDLMTFPIQSYYKQKYLLVIFDDCTSFVWVKPLAKKSNVILVFKQWCAFVHNQYALSIKTIRSDRGGEFMSTEMQEYLKEKGIIHELSTPYIHQQNGKVERMNRTLWEKSEAIRLHASCPNSWWNFAIETAVHVYNRTPLRRTKWKTPVENLTGKKPDVSYFKIFGTKAWVYIPHESRENKLTPKSEIMTFIGYELNAKAYRFMTNTNQFKVSTQAEFDETKFPRAKPLDINYTKDLEFIRPIDWDNSDNTDNNISNGKPDDESDGDISSELQNSDDDFYEFNFDDSSSSDSDSDDDDDELNWKKHKNLDDSESFYKKEQSSQDKGVELDQPTGVELDQPVQNLEKDQSTTKPIRGKKTYKPPVLPLRRSERLRQPVIQKDNAYGDKTPLEIEKEISEEQDIVKELLQVLRKEEESKEFNIDQKYSLRLQIRQHIYKVKKLYSNLNIAQIDELENLIKDSGNGFLNFLLAQAIPTHNIPIEKNIRDYLYKDILKVKTIDPEGFKQWELAMDDEMNSLNERKIWELTELPQDRNIIKCRWVFDIKSDGRKKARLVAKGFSQRPGIDYDETFSPVARYETIRLLLAISVLEKWDIEALDVKTAFLYGDLEADIYMQQPEGYIVKGQENKVYRLKKAIYGLKQASYAWNKKANKSLEDLGFKRCLSDSGVYVRRINNTITVCIVYVDDILFMGDNSSEISKVKNGFMKMWECKDLGKVKEYLGMKIEYNKNLGTLIINQEAYAKKVVARFGLENSKPTRTPLPTGYNPTAATLPCSKEQRHDYQMIIGSLLYLALGTRPDITYPVILMSQFCANPNQEHIQKALYIVKYVNTTLKTQIVYNNRKKEGFIAFADADWGADRISRKSITGNVVKLAGGAISWVSRKQKVVAQSSTEAEYMCMSDTTRQIVWIESLMFELQFPIKTIFLCCDNQGAMFLSSNPAQEHRSKHIDIRYHYIRECVENEKVKLTYVPTNEQIADIMTKNLPYPKFVQFRMKMGLILDDNPTSLERLIRASSTFYKYVKSKDSDKSINRNTKMFEKIQDIEVRGYLEELFKYYENENDRLNRIVDKTT